MRYDWNLTCDNPNPLDSIRVKNIRISRFGFAVLFYKSIAEARRIASVHTEVCRKVGVPEFNMDPLRAVCVLFFLMCSVAAAGLLLLVVVHPT